MNADGIGSAALESCSGNSQHRSAEEALRESEQKYRLLFNTNPDGVFLVDTQGRFTMVNPACEVLSGYSSQELIGRHFAELCAPDQLTKTTAAFERVLQDPSYTELETALVHKDGHRVELWIAGEPLLKEGLPVAIHCTAKNVTQRKQSQADLERIVDERTTALKQAVDQLNAFVHALAHDFKAPVRAQSGFARALLEDFGDTLGSQGRALALRIFEAAQTQLRLVNDLLEHVRLSREDLPLEPVDLRGAVEQAQNHLASDIAHCDARVTVGTLDGLVWANASCLHLVLTNLLSNALKFVRKGIAPRIDIWSERTAAPAEVGSQRVAPAREMIRLWIQDNGIGIPEADQRRLFRPFQRLQADQDYPGTGIGLALVKQATERLHGTLGVESKPGQGSRFWIQLPAANPAFSRTGM